MALLMIVNTPSNPFEWNAYPLLSLAEKEALLDYLSEIDMEPQHIVILDDSNGFYFLESSEGESILLEDMVNEMEEA